VDAKGDGPLAPALGQRPTDLTGIARAHGVSEMSVWGDVFEPRSGWTPEAVVGARGRVVLITEYLRSIQAR
jgi:hypothetical protein